MSILMGIVDLYRRFIARAAGSGDVSRVASRIAMALSIFGVLILGTIAFAGWSANETSTHRERTLVDNAINRTIARTLDEQKSVAWWDDSITSIRPGAIDFDFVDANFGYFLTETYGHDDVFILDAQDEPIYGFREGKRLVSADFEARRADLAPVIAQARGIDPEGLRLRPDLFAQSQDSYDTLGGPLHLSHWSGHVLEVDGRPAVVAALTIVPNVDMSLMPPTPNLLVSVRFIDQDFVSDIGRSLLLHDLEIGSQASHAPGHVSEPFLTDDWVAAGPLTWTTLQPGRPLLAIILPMAAIMLLAAGLLFRRMVRDLNAASFELAASEARARHEAKHDALSGLPNRAHFSEQLEAFLSEVEDEPMSKALVAYFDIDRFKDVNDTLGHRAGDCLIQGVSARLRGLLPPDVVLARFGGDEFALMCSPADPKRISVVEQALKEAFSQSFDIDGQSICATVSVGCAIAPDDGRDVEEIMRHADIALYQAKANGRDRTVMFSHDMARSVLERRMTELELQSAMESDQLELHYQPIISSATQRVTGLEALLRWNHPTRGNISPGTFIPIAEETGLMPKLGEWIIDRAMRDAAQWPELEIALNLSPVQIRHLDLVSTLRRLIALHGIDPKRFVLEITEGVLLDPSEFSRRAVTELRALGFKTSLDDFGTGYSSLSYLCNFAFDKIKIDRSFVTGQSSSKRALTIVKTVAALGRGLGMSVVAEGVETEIDAVRMRQLGCTELQGFFYARPMQADKIEAVVAQQAAKAEEFERSTGSTPVLGASLLRKAD